MSKADELAIRELKIYLFVATSDKQVTINDICRELCMPRHLVYPAITWLWKRNAVKRRTECYWNGMYYNYRHWYW